MSGGTRAVKMTAKTVLKTNWLRAITVGLIFIFTVLICENISELLSLLFGRGFSIGFSTAFTLCLTLPLFLGVIRYIWRMLFDAEDNPILVFYWFSSFEVYKKAIKLIFSLALRAIFWLAILNVPTFFLYIMSHSNVFEFFDMAMPLWTANLPYIIGFLRSATVVATLFIMMKHYMAPVLFVVDDSIDYDEAIHMSTVISRRSSVDFVYLGFSLIVYIALSFFYIPLIFTLPYILTCYAVHVRFAIAEYNRHISEKEKNSYANMSFGV